MTDWPDLDNPPSVTDEPPPVGRGCVLVLAVMVLFWCAAAAYWMGVLR